MSKIYIIPVWVFQAIIHYNLQQLNPSQQKLLTAFEERVSGECGEGQCDIDSTVLYAEPFSRNDVTDQTAWCVTITYTRNDPLSTLQTKSDFLCPFYSCISLQLQSYMGA